MEIILDEDHVSQKGTPEDLFSRADELKYEGYAFKHRQYIEKGFRLFFKEPLYFLGYLVITGILTSGAGLFQTSGGNEYGLSLGILSIFLSGHLSVGWFIVAHKIDVGEEVNFGNFFDGFKKYWPIFLVYILSGLSIVAGFFLFFFPGVFLAVALSFAMYPVYFNDMLPSDAMKVSIIIIKRKWFSFLGFFFLLLFVNIGGLLALGIGVLITWPASILAFYAAYQDIVQVSRID